MHLTSSVFCLRAFFFLYEFHVNSIISLYRKLPDVVKKLKAAPALLCWPHRALFSEVNSVSAVHSGPHLSGEHGIK